MSPISDTEPRPPHRTQCPVPPQKRHSAPASPPVPPQSSQIFQPWQSGQSPSYGISSEIRVSSPSPVAMRFPPVVRIRSFARNDPPCRIRDSEMSGSFGVMMTEASSSVDGSGPSTSFDTISPRRIDRRSDAIGLVTPVTRQANLDPLRRGSVPSSITTRAYCPMMDPSAILRFIGLWGHETRASDSQGCDNRERGPGLWVVVHIGLATGSDGAQR